MLCWFLVTLYLYSPLKTLCRDGLIPLYNMTSDQGSFLKCEMGFLCSRCANLYNIIQIHDNIVWDFEYSTEWSHIQAECEKYSI